jgi:hypothetical protein
MKRRCATTLVLFLSLALLAAGCGSSSKSSSSSSGSASAANSNAVPPPAINALAQAEAPRASQFPAAGGHTLQQLASKVVGSVQLGAATGTFTPGKRRFAFALNTSSGSFIYAPTALYIAPKPGARASGPFLAPADPMVVSPQDRSKENAGPGGIQAIYAANLPLPRKGTFTVLAVTATPRGLIGAPGEIAVAASSPIPDVGQRPPAVATDTSASVHGNTSLLTTRMPPEQMQSAPFNALLGKQPVALLFSTPQLCMSKVCGPVTDIAVSLQRQFGSRIAFIHQEVYVDNQPSRGLRPALRAFHLQTEPWLFTINRQGKVAARLEGSFGVNAFTQALQAALR